MCFFPLMLMAQFPHVPQEIKEEVRLKQLSFNGTMMSYGISYPTGYEEDKKYKVLLCLSGGSFSTQLAYYYHHVYSPKESFQTFIKIYLISPPNKSLLAFSASD